MSQSFECLLCKHSFSFADSPTTKVLSFLLFVVALILLFSFWPLAIVLFIVIWSVNLPKCPRCKSKKLLRQEKIVKDKPREYSDNEKISERKRGVGAMTIILGGTVAFVVFLMSVLFWLVASAPPKPESIYSTSEADLTVAIDEEKGYDMLDVQYALGRLIDDKPVNQYPFFAMKDPQGGGYFGIFELPSPSGTFMGEAIFLVSEEALSSPRILTLKLRTKLAPSLSVTVT
ncbi:hypothetical protein EBT25_19285 [bacterium]|nr:hypothetical protein [bacterium]